MEGFLIYTLSNDIYTPENMRDHEIAANDMRFEKITEKPRAEELVNEGRLVKTYLVPIDIGGNADEENIVYLTPLALKEKELLDERLRALICYWGGKLKYTYTTDNYGDSLVPKNIYVRHDAPPSAFVFSFSCKGVV